MADKKVTKDDLFSQARLCRQSRRNEGCPQASLGILQHSTFCRGGYHGQKRANGADISPATLSGVKVGLIGPLAGVGDPIFRGTIRPVLAALSAGIHWYGVKYGYEKGTELVENIGGNEMKFLTEGASVLGLLVMGALGIVGYAIGLLA